MFRVKTSQATKRILLKRLVFLVDEFSTLEDKAFLF